MTSPKFDAEVAAKGVLMGSFGALRALGDLKLPPCPYPAHRSTDWSKRGVGIVTCGVCHPPAPGVEVE